MRGIKKQAYEYLEHSLRSDLMRVEIDINRGMREINELANKQKVLRVARKIILEKLRSLDVVSGVEKDNKVKSVEK